MKSIEYQNDLNHSDQGEEKLIENIKGDFSEFDRIFCNWNNKDNVGSLLLFSKEKQIFQSLNLQTKQVSALELSDEKEYRQVELYDGKLFCVSENPVTITIFFDSKRKKLFHKKIIFFANKQTRLKEDFRFLVWKQHEQGAVYRCLLGPLADGRYMNFDLSERFFDANSDVEQVITSIFFVSLTLNDDINNDSVKLICMDEVKKTVICCTKSENFFEYNGFIQEPSYLLNMFYNKRFPLSKLRKMYCYSPYNFFPQKIKNKLKNISRKVNREMDLEIFLKERYREILLCVEGENLLKIVSLTEYPLSDFPFWSVDSVGNNNIVNPYDIAINDQTGEIYCLCSDGIKVLKDSGRNIEEFMKKYDVVEDVMYKNDNS